MARLQSDDVSGKRSLVRHNVPCCAAEPRPTHNSDIISVLFSDACLQTQGGTAAIPFDVPRWLKSVLAFDDTRRQL